MSITPDVLLGFFALLSPVTHGRKKSPKALAAVKTAVLRRPALCYRAPAQNRSGSESTTADRAVGMDLVEQAA